MKSITSCSYSIVMVLLLCLQASNACSQNESPAPPSPAPLVQEPVREGEPYTVEKMPVFNGGQEKMYKYLIECMSADSTSQSHGGTVIGRFIVASDGSIQNVIILRSPDPTMATVVKKCLSDMPDWIPGEHEGKKVPVIFTVPVRYIGQ
jgi:hypothetical protein